jgi:hypothetical protein
MRRKVWPLAYHGVLPRSAGTKEIADDRQSGRAIIRSESSLLHQLFQLCRGFPTTHFGLFYLWARNYFPREIETGSGARS